MSGWRAWYATSRTTWVVYSSAETAWEEIPPGDPDVPEGVVGVVVYLSETVTPYRRIVDGVDWCWLEDGVVRSVDTHPEWGKYADPPEDVDPAILKRCVAMDDDAWSEVQREMLAAREAPE